VTSAAPNLAGFAAAADAAAVGEDLARALAALLCRGLAHQAEGACADCLIAGHVLARPVGSALLARASGSQRLKPGDYLAVGRALEELELQAGVRLGNGRRARG
jgi:hypothetical protein